MCQPCAGLAIDIPVQPSAQFSCDKLSQRLDMRWFGIQAGDVLIAGAAGFEEGIPVFHADFFDGFETVCGKPWADHLHLGDTLLGQGLQSLVGIGLQPLFSAKS